MQVLNGVLAMQQQQQQQQQQKRECLPLTKNELYL
jgi:hypothetical protein